MMFAGPVTISASFQNWQSGNFCWDQVKSASWFYFSNGKHIFDTYRIDWNHISHSFHPLSIWGINKCNLYSSP